MSFSTYFHIGILFSIAFFPLNIEYGSKESKEDLKDTSTFMALGFAIVFGWPVIGTYLLLRGSTGE